MTIAKTLALAAALFAAAASGALTVTFACASNPDCNATRYPCLTGTCTAGACVQKADGASCGSDEYCVVANCSKGVCVPNPWPVACDAYEGTNQCLTTACVWGTGCGTVNRDDGYPCTVERLYGGQNITTHGACLNGTCAVFAAGIDCTNDTQCSDGLRCTVDTCNETSGTCVHVPIPNCCKRAEDCHDGNPCTRNLCDMGTGTCVYTPIEGCCTDDLTCRRARPTSANAWCAIATNTCVYATAKPCSTADDCVLQTDLPLCVDGLCAAPASSSAPA